MRLNWRRREKSWRITEDNPGIRRILLHRSAETTDMRDEMLQAHTQNNRQPLDTLYKALRFHPSEPGKAKGVA